MPNFFYLIVVVTTFVLTYNHANGDDGDDWKLLKLRDKAVDCEVGTRVKIDMCNVCVCKVKGVMVCTRMWCPEPEIPQDGDDDYKDDDEPDEEDNKLAMFKKLRGKAANCEKGQEERHGCMKCVCALEGVFRCKRLKGCRE